MDEKFLVFTINEFQSFLQLFTQKGGSNDRWQN